MTDSKNKICLCHGCHRMSAGNNPEERIRKRKIKRKQKLVAKAQPMGTLVISAIGKFRIIDLLGSGGFGDVYKVEQIFDIATGGSFAMKTEPLDVADKNLCRLKMETHVLKEIHRTEGTERVKQHFLQMVDRGKTSEFKFLIMGLAGPNLHELRKDILGIQNFEPEDVIQMGIQTLESIWHLHEVGYLHRDIKPQNFAVGVGLREETIYMLDFGISRKYIMIRDGKRVQKPIRRPVKFIGTMRYASRACHANREQGRCDDLECWIYMMVDLFDRKVLPWTHKHDRDDVFKIKKRFFEFHYIDLFRNIHEDFRLIMKYVNCMETESTPDYSKIIEMLKAMGDAAGLKWQKKPSWVGEIDGKKKKKKKSKEKEGGEIADDELIEDSEVEEKEDEEFSEKDDAEKIKSREKTWDIPTKDDKTRMSNTGSTLGTTSCPRSNVLAVTASKYDKNANASKTESKIKNDKTCQSMTGSTLGTTSCPRSNVIAMTASKYDQQPATPRKESAKSKEEAKSMTSITGTTMTTSTYPNSNVIAVPYSKK